MADKKKKQAGHRAYLNDFHRDLTGAYIYDGSHFHFAGDGWKQTLLRRDHGPLCVPDPALSRGGGSRGQRRLGAGAADVRRRDAAGLRLQGHRSGAAGTGRAGDVRRRGRNAGDGAVHDRPRNGGTAGRAAAVSFAEGSASGRGMAAAALCADPAMGGAAGGDGGLMFSVCERRIAISVLFKYI